MSACNAFTEHVWKPGECKNCFKPKSLHQPPEGASVGAQSNATPTDSGPRGGSSREAHVRPPVAKKPTIAVKPTMMSPCSPAGLDSEGNVSRLTEAARAEKSDARPTGLNNDPDGRSESHAVTRSGDNGLTDVLKEIAGLGSLPHPSRGDFFGRICSSYRRSLERGLPASGCLHAGSGMRGAVKRVSLSGSAEVISAEGGRFCYPEFSSDGDDEGEDSEEEGAERDSWDESDEELLAMGIRMRGQPRFANFRAATMSPVPFAAGKKWNTVPLRNRSLQRLCAVDYDDSYDEILNGYSTADSNMAPALLSYSSDHQSSDFLSTSDSTTSPESLASLPEESNTSQRSAEQRNSHPFPSRPEPSASRAVVPKLNEIHKAVLAIRLEEQDAGQREHGAMPQALPGQPITISFSPTEEQAKPYRVVNLEKAPVCKPYTIVDVSASMSSKEDPDPKSPSLGVPLNSSIDACTVSPSIPQSPVSPAASPSVPLSPLTPTSAFRSKPGSVRYQEVWTSCTSPRQKIPKVDFTTGGADPRVANHKSAPTSPTTGLGCARTVPTKSPNLSEIKFNSYNNAGMPPFPIIIRDEPAYAHSSKKAVKVPIVINPCAYDNLAVYKSFLGLNGELAHSKSGERVASHTYEEIGSSESTQSSPTDQKQAPAKHEVDRGSSAGPTTSRVTPDGKSPTTPVLLSPDAASPLLNHSARDPSCNLSLECRQASPSGRSGTKEKANAVLSQIVSSIQPPQSPRDAHTGRSKTGSNEEVLTLPHGGSKETLTRPKSLHCSVEPHKDPAAKLLPKSLSASAAVPPSSPTSETSSPFPPARSILSPYHSGNLLQKHFSNWTRAGGLKPSDGETSPGVEGRRPPDSNKPKRWISFKSFFRRRKDEDEQKEKVEREKEKGKLLGLDGTVITVLPPPPVQRRHWFAEAKTDDPQKKPTIIFTYKSEGGEEAERHEERPGVVAEGGASGAATPPRSRASLLISKVMNQLPAPDAERCSSATSLPTKLDLSPLRELPACCPPPSSSSSSSSPPTVRETEDERHTHSISPASSCCRATYTNLGQSRANMIPVKHPRHPRASDDALNSDPELGEPHPKLTPPPLPKKLVPPAPTQPKGEATPSGASLSLANPLYDLESTWETGSQSSSLGSDARHHDEFGDSLERPVGGRSLSCLTDSGLAQGAERRGCRSTESLAGGSRGHAQKAAPGRGMESWEEVVGRIRGLHADTLRKLAARCEERFMAGQRAHTRFGTDSWSHFRLTVGRPCCEAGDAVYYAASYAKDPLANYAVKICRSALGESQQQQIFHSLAVRQSVGLHFNIQQDCGHFLAEVPARLLPPDEEEEQEEQEEGPLCSRMVVITREVPFQTLADFVREGEERHARNPELYERQVCLLLLQLCAGLEHMKPRHVTHCDLRLHNLLLVRCCPPDTPEPSGPARLIISNFSQARLKEAEPEPLSPRDRARLAPELLAAAHFRKCDEFQTGILVYELLHRRNPFEDTPQLTPSGPDLPLLPLRSLYSRGLQRLASLLLQPDPARRIQVGDARACLQCLLWGPREDLFSPLSPGGLLRRRTLLQNWLDLKRTLMTIKFAERSVDSTHAVSLEDWLCCRYLAFANPESLGRAARILQLPQGVLI